MKNYFPKHLIIIGNNLVELDKMETESVQCIVTSPPYWKQRDYGHSDQIGLEQDPKEYVGNLVRVLSKARRVLRYDGCVWLVIGDTYAGGGCGGGGSFARDRVHLANKNKQAWWKKNARTPAGFKDKDLIGIPWRVAFALQEDGWFLRQDIIWSKPNPMPENVEDRCTKSHEYIFLLSKSHRYYFNPLAIREKGIYPAGTRGAKGGSYRYGQGISSRPPEYKIYSGYRNKRTVWTVNTKPCRERHYATYPSELIEPCILASTRPGDTVLDIFVGTGTTMEVALKHDRRAIGIDVNPKCRAMIRRRLKKLKQ